MNGGEKDKTSAHESIDRTRLLKREANPLASACRFTALLAVAIAACELEKHGERARLASCDVDARTIAKVATATSQWFSIHR
jgi:hypothetical protein